MRISTFLLVAALGLSCNNVAQGQKQGASGTQDPAKTDLEAAEFKARMAAGNGKLVDVRTPAEFKSGHIEGAVNIDWSASDYETSFAKLDPKEPVLVYCAMGGRSDQAKEYLVGKGFTVIQLVDGISGWKKAGLPVVKN